MAGPLSGTRIIELAGIGPGPFAGMMLADHGAEVIRVERPGSETDPTDILLRSRSVVTLDLKSETDRATLLELVRGADALIEGYRPGTIERMGIGPDVLLTENPRLVIGRMTGWGQQGPYATTAGHDINYISVTGALHAIGPAEKPCPPLALAGDFGGGGMLLAFAIAAALLHSQRTGEGQVIDCAMSDGAGLLMAPFYSYHAAGWWKDERCQNILDGGAHFYNAYETADGKFISVGTVERHFYDILLDLIGLGEDPAFAEQMDRDAWPAQRERLAQVFRTRTRQQWCELLEGTDACFAPVLSLGEAPYHKQAVQRGSFLTIDGVIQPAPAPRYSATPLERPRGAPVPLPIPARA